MKIIAFRFRQLSESENEETASEPHIMPSQVVVSDFLDENVTNY